MKEHKGLTTADLTPQQALNFLKEGNDRFINSLSKNRNHLEVVNETKDGQKPFAAILSCMDSRTSAELIFDQGLGDIFSVRIAGNIANEDILGSLEYAVAAAGSKLILVLGHTGCGAVKGACDNVELGNLTGLLKKISPSVKEETNTQGDRSSNNIDFVNAVAAINVKNTVKDIVSQSDTIRGLIDNGTIGIAAAMYDVATGAVTFHDKEAIMPTQKKEAVA